MDEPANGPMAPADVPRPDYAAAAPSDWMGSRAVEVMLEDLEFPATAKALRERAGNWRVPIRGSEETVPLGALLEGFDDDTRFRSAHSAADAIRKSFHRF